jgi:uncharacterized protein YodC (DUF2158 family)
MDNPFKPGDRVQLNSGGPTMTCGYEESGNLFIGSTGQYDPPRFGKGVHLFWFVEGQLLEASIPFQALVKA